MDDAVSLAPRARTTAATAVATCICLAAAIAARSDDWIGDRYGWEVRAGVLRATTDGGAHWTPVRPFENDDLWAYAHTGLTTGIVVLGDPNALEAAWTPDNGTSWFDVPGLKPFQGALEGHGAFAFWGGAPSVNGKARRGRLYQLTPWPPGLLQRTCSIRLERTITGSKRCRKPRSPVRSRVVVSLSSGYVSQIRSAPGGAVALVQEAGAGGITPLRLVIRRNGKHRLVALPPIASDRATSIVSAVLSLDWPRIVVIGNGRASDGVTDVVRAVWSSSDGGVTWHITLGT
jgi:hypothetical protein